MAECGSEWEWRGVGVMMSNVRRKPGGGMLPGDADVLQASETTLQQLQHKANTAFAFSAFETYPCYNNGSRVSGRGGYAVEVSTDEEDQGGSCELRKDEYGRKNVRVNKEEVVGDKGGWDGEKAVERDGGGGVDRIGGVGKGDSGPDFNSAYYWPVQGVMPPGDPGQYGSVGSDQGGYGGLEAGSESTKGASLDNKSRKMGDTESDDVDSGECQDGNTARTLKRPRLVWTPQLHKRFVDAVGHLGIKNAVPKTIMQLMNVEGLTRENVASHLQKYRLYLKRMEGQSTEAHSASDPLFSSAPLPPNLSAPPHFFTSHHHPRPDNGVTGPSFSSHAVLVPRAQQAMPPGVMRPGAFQHFGVFEHSPNIIELARSGALQKPPNAGDHTEFSVHAHSGTSGDADSPPHRTLTLFPMSSQPLNKRQKFVESRCRGVNVDY